MLTCNFMKIGQVFHKVKWRYSQTAWYSVGRLNYWWSSLAQSFLVHSSTGLMTLFDSLTTLGNVQVHWRRRNIINWFSFFDKEDWKVASGPHFVKIRNALLEHGSYLRVYEYTPLKPQLGHNFIHRFFKRSLVESKVHFCVAFIS
jgi:hypothetical protein